MMRRPPTITNIDDFSREIQDFVDDRIDQDFPDVLPELEIRLGGLTREQLLFFERYWRLNGPQDTSEREMWLAIKQARERKRVEAERPSTRREVIYIFGRRTVVFRDSRTGRFARGPRRR